MHIYIIQPHTYIHTHTYTCKAYLADGMAFVSLGGPDAKLAKGGTPESDFKATDGLAGLTRSPCSSGVGVTWIYVCMYVCMYVCATETDGVTLLTHRTYKCNYTHIDTQTHSGMPTKEVLES